MDKEKLTLEQIEICNNIDLSLKELFGIDINENIENNKNKFKENRNDKKFRNKLNLFRNKLLERKIVNTNFQEMLFIMKEDKLKYNNEKLLFLEKFQFSITILIVEILQFADSENIVNELLLNSRTQLNLSFISFLEFYTIFNKDFNV